MLGKLFQRDMYREHGVKYDSQNKHLSHIHRSAPRLQIAPKEYFIININFTINSCNFYISRNKDISVFFRNHIGQYFFK